MKNFNFKSFVMGCLITTLILSTTFVFANPQQVEVLYNNIKIKINGSYIQTDVEPFIKDGRVFVPAKFIAEPLGAKVKWDTKNNTMEIDSMSLIPEVVKNPVPINMSNEKDEDNNKDNQTSENIIETTKPQMQFANIGEEVEMYKSKVKLNGIEYTNKKHENFNELKHAIIDIDYFLPERPITIWGEEEKVFAPFLPSVLNSGGDEIRVMTAKEMQESEKDIVVNKWVNYKLSLWIKPNNKIKSIIVSDTLAGNYRVEFNVN